MIASYRNDVSLGPFDVHESQGANRPQRRAHREIRAAIDLFVVPTIRFNLVYAFIRLSSSEVRTHIVPFMPSNS